MRCITVRGWENAGVLKRGVRGIGLIAIGGLCLTLGWSSTATAQSGLLAPDSRCGAQAGPSAPAPAQERAMRCLINYARTHAGRRPLGKSAKLTRSADGKLQDVTRCGELSHTACERGLRYWFGRVGFLAGCPRVGEALALGTNVLGSARAIMKRWLRSPPNRRLLLARVFEVQGVATKRDRVGRIPRAHVWVVHLGAHLPGTC